MIPVLFQYADGSCQELLVEPTVFVNKLCKQGAKDGMLPVRATIPEEFFRALRKLRVLH